MRRPAPPSVPSATRGIKHGCPMSVPIFALCWVLVRSLVGPICLTASAPPNGRAMCRHGGRWVPGVSGDEVAAVVVVRLRRGDVPKYGVLRTLCSAWCTSRCFQEDDLECRVGRGAGRSRQGGALLVLRHCGGATAGLRLWRAVDLLPVEATSS